MTVIGHKIFNHFSDTSKVYDVLNEIRSRHRGGYIPLLNSIISQIYNFYKKNSITNKEKIKFIIGLSGGLDSSLVTYLAVKAIGVENVIPITMPARSNDKESIIKAAIVREKLGFNNPNFNYVIPIEEIVQTEIETMNNLKWDLVRINIDSESQDFTDKIRIGNFASRARVAILYDLAKKLNGRILGPNNKTEFVQGYAAKYGTPISYDYGVLDDLYKIDIIELAKIIGVPNEIINSVPSSGYFPGQTHMQELGASLEEQDVMAYLLFEKKLQPSTVVAHYGVKEKFVQLMLERYKNSAHKRMLRQKHVTITSCKDDV